MFSFEENVGQASSEFALFSRGPGYAIGFAKSGAAIYLGSDDDSAPGSATDVASPPAAGLRLSPVGADSLAQAIGHRELPQRSHYLVGSPDRWHTGVRHYQRVHYHDVYPGIDLEFHSKSGGLEYDFAIAPGADPALIAIDYEGAERIEADASGDLLVYFGGQVVRQRPPVAYQDRDGVREEIPCRHVVSGAHRVRFELAEYDAARPVVIDPVLLFSGLLGGPGLDQGRALARDDQGFVYVAGQADASPVLTAEFGPPSDTTDALLIKMDPLGNVVQTTYFGGSKGDAARGVAVDANGAAYVVGETYSGDFPTAGSVQPSPGGGTDAFVAKISPDGMSIEWASYLGGSGEESANAVGLDGQGQTAVYGYTTSTDLPTVNALQPQFGGERDAFVAKFDATGASLVYQTYLGGDREEDSDGTTADAAVDAAGNVYVSGTTESLDFPTVNAIQPNHRFGGRDGFVAKLDPAGQNLLFSTFIGGGGGDTVRGMALGPDGSIFLTGGTRSYDFPIVGSVQKRKREIYDAFVTKLDPTAQQIVYSTYLGGGMRDAGSSITVDDAGNAYVLGFTFSDDFPILDPAQYALGGSWDVFVAKLTPSGSALVFSTFLGGGSGELAYGWDSGIVVSDEKLVTVVGSTLSGDFPLVDAPRPPQPYFDAFLSTFSAGIEVVASAQTIAGGASIDVNLMNLGPEDASVELRAWVDVPALGTTFAIPNAPTGVQLLGPGETLAAITGETLGDEFLLAGTRIVARLIDPVTGRTLSESVCEAVPCH